MGTITAYQPAQPLLPREPQQSRSHIARRDVGFCPGQPGTSSTLWWPHGWWWRLLALDATRSPTCSPTCQQQHQHLRRTQLGRWLRRLWLLALWWLWIFSLRWRYVHTNVPWHHLDRHFSSRTAPTVLFAAAAEGTATVGSRPSHDTTAAVT